MKEAGNILEYHDELRLAIQPKSRPTNGRTKAQALNLIAGHLNEGWTVDELRAAARGHLADGSWWRENGKMLARYAYDDPGRIHEFVETGREEPEPTKETPPGDDDWFEDDDWEDYDGTWEGLEE